MNGCLVEYKAISLLFEFKLRYVSEYFLSFKIIIQFEFVGYSLILNIIKISIEQ